MNKFRFAGLAIALSLGASAQTVYELPRIATLLRECPLDSKIICCSTAGVTLPYTENFDTPDVSTALPAGWSVSDASATAAFTIQVNALSGITAHSGKYYLVSGPDSRGNARDAWAFSPALSLEAGKPYYIALYCFAPGYQGVADQFEITVGSEASAAAQTQRLVDRTGEQAEICTEWTKVEGVFTPETAGEYYFAIHHCTPAGTQGNAVGFDDFTVSSEPLVELPSVEAYYTGGLWSFTADTVYVGDSEPLNYGATGQNVDSYSWEFGTDATPASVQAASASVVYGTDGVKQGVVTATNENGTASDTLETGVVHLSPAVMDYVCNRRKSDELTTYQVSEYGFMLGLNSNYTTIAEKFTLPDNARGEVDEVVIYTYLYALDAANQEKSLILSIYDEGPDGLPGEAVASFSGRLGELFGSENSVGQFCTAFFPAVEVTGSFFVVLEFPEITPDADNMLGLVSTKSRTQDDCTAYANYQGRWYAMNSLYGGANLSSMISPRYRFVAVSAVQNVANDSALSLSMTGETLYIRGTVAGDLYRVFDLSGRMVATGATDEAETVVSLSGLSSGVYVVCIGGRPVGKMVR